MFPVMQRSLAKRSPLLALGLMALLAGYNWLSGGGALPDLFGGAGSQIEALYASGESGVVVEAAGEVVATLRDDNEGSRHQRFIVRLGSGHTVLVSHNIDLAPRVDRLAKGDRVAFRGQYEWNDRGGVVHWTHHDPQGRRPGGWVELDGRRYR